MQHCNKATAAMTKLWGALLLWMLLIAVISSGNAFPLGTNHRHIGTFHAFSVVSPRCGCRLLRTKVEEEDDDDMLSMEAFQKAKERAQKQQAAASAAAELEEFDGYKMRDAIYEKWGACYDVDFNRVDSFGFRSLYLNVLPFQLGRRPFRHETELDYLCHLQAVVEILQKYKNLEYVLYQIQETDKKPRPGTSPLVAVPLRLDLTPEQVKQITNA
ncbi:expressed unknown protein [Seminavis robusta]|uniref:Uncharacterized protein n=1 Tax=Seminavis robusta TaxID=568900 RepID=A0A9N8EYC9_9STRA|nr:expressed unknown protein [Seminavis robusta]|eukprot:Sro2854_g338690.1 n/a (215) ;mRNA; f:2873-3517